MIYKVRVEQKYDEFYFESWRDADEFATSYRNRRNVGHVQIFAADCGKWKQLYTYTEHIQNKEGS